MKLGSGLPWVAVRPSSFATNVIGMFGAQIRGGDVVGAPYGDFAEEFVSALMARYERGAGQPAEVTDEVRRVLVRPARNFGQWVADHAGAFGGVTGGVI
ncbi:hypothetical protein ABZX12_27240 [Kribbella sp. NPDC003505]|uniref:hypothetical protein n=1 Tax=Kribbella sp. NPDC003505 TaxID=3154448 RepID=UPI0033B808DB